MRRAKWAARKRAKGGSAAPSGWDKVVGFVKDATRCRLLVLPCSARKRPTRTAVPALELYDGPAYQSLRKLVARGGLPADVMIVIVSARYGVISPSDLVRPYDRRLDPSRDARLIASARRRLTKVAARLCPRRVLSLLGRDYRACLPSTWMTAPNVEHVNGPHGRRVRQMLDWLESESTCV